MRAHICEYNLRMICTRARVCTVCSLALGGEGGGVICDSRRDMISSLFLWKVEVYVCVCVCVCVRTYLHTLHVGYSVVSPGI